MIIDTQKWQEIFITLRQHKLRTGLTAFGVFWGIFMLTVLLGAGKGLENGVMEGFRGVPNAVWIWSQGRTQVPYQGMPIGRQIILRPDDLPAIRDNIPTVDRLYPQNSVGIWGGSPAYTVYEQNSGSFSVQGAMAGMAGIFRQRVVEGRYLNTLDDRERRKVVIIGQRVKDQLFAPGEAAVGQYLTIDGISFQVVGVYASTSTEPDSSEEERIYMPNDTLRQTFNQTAWIGSMVVIPKPGVHAANVEQQVKSFLHERKQVAPYDVGVLGSFNLQTEFDKINGLFTGIQVFSWFVAIGTIMAGALGVGNIMLIVVRERTREIGLRKALGATPTSIVAMIVQESIFITAVAGYTGLVAGVLLLEGVNALLAASGGRAGMFSNPEVDFTTALMALAVLIVSGVIAALLPAAKAASVNPIAALQDE